MLRVKGVLDFAASPARQLLLKVTSASLRLTAAIQHFYFDPVIGLLRRPVWLVGWLAWLFKREEDAMQDGAACTTM